jgi:hypothetical protein
LAHILDDPAVKNILNGEPRDEENNWTLSTLMETLKTLPVILMYAKLAYKFEVMTDVLNGTFVEESLGWQVLYGLLPLATGSQYMKYHHEVVVEVVCVVVHAAVDVGETVGLPQDLPGMSSRNVQRVVEIMMNRHVSNLETNWCRRPLR